MKKIFKLFINENIKTWKKLATKILIILVFLALIGTVVLAQVIKSIEQSVQYTHDYDWKTDITQQLEYFNTELQNNNLSEEYKESLQIQKERYQLALDYDINPYTDTWRANLLNNELATLRVQGESENIIQKLIQIIKNDDFEGYINLQKEELKVELDKKEITEEQYNNKILILDLKAKCEIGKSEINEYWKSSLIYEIERAQESIRTGIDSETNRVLTVEKKQEYEDKILMSIYRLENNIPPTEWSNSSRTMFEALAPAFVCATIAILAIIMAGGAISTEVSTGTIKFWALTPNKRWKIMTAKILSILFYVVVITLVAALLTSVFGSLLFEEEAEPYIYAKDGVVKTINNTLYLVGIYFAKIIPVVLFAIFAIMLSTITRNTAVAVSLSMALYMGNGIVMTIINEFVKKDWIRYIPFNNLNVADKIFPNAYNPIAIAEETFATSTSLEFSLAVLGVCAILMLITLYDSFNKRDIV